MTITVLPQDKEQLQYKTTVSDTDEKDTMVVFVALSKVINFNCDCQIEYQHIKK